MKRQSLIDLPPSPPGKFGWPWGPVQAQEPARALEGRTLPRISVVTPSYNQGEFLEEAIRSVLLQGYPNLEYIIIDGGSTDASLDIIRKYESWISFWSSERDRGQSHAINKGFRLAKGDLLAWINSDDLYAPLAFWKIARASLENPSAVLIYGAGRKVDTTGNLLKQIPFRPYDPKLLLTRYYILQQASFFRRSAFIRAGLLDESIQYFMDWDLAIRMSQLGSFLAIPEEIGIFRVHPRAKIQTSGWERKREIAEIGKKYNGITDPNFLTFWPLFWSYYMAKKTKAKVFSRLGKWLTRQFDKLYGAETYMMR